MNARQIIRSIPPGGKRTDLDKAHEIIRKQQKEINWLRANFEDLNEKYAQSESDRLDAEAKLERLHQLIERQHPAPENN